MNEKYKGNGRSTALFLGPLPRNILLQSVHIIFKILFGLVHNSVTHPLLLRAAAAAAAGASLLSSLPRVKVGDRARRPLGQTGRRRQKGDQGWTMECEREEKSERVHERRGEEREFLRGKIATLILQRQRGTATAPTSPRRS